MGRGASSPQPNRAGAVHLFRSANDGLLGCARRSWEPRAASFFVFASVFNLFVVSLFWILLSDIYQSGQAKRLYGFIAAGGTTGAVLGPLVANWLAPKLGGWDLILVAAVVLLAAAALSFWLRDTAVSGADRDNIDAPPGFRTVMSGAESVIRDPICCASRSTG